MQAFFFFRFAQAAEPYVVIVAFLWVDTDIVCRGNIAFGIALAKAKKQIVVYFEPVIVYLWVGIVGESFMLALVRGRLWCNPD